MATSTAGPVSRHRLALGRIPGLEINDTIFVPGVPGRDFLQCNKYCNEPALEDRQTINGIYLVQTVDWFLEFAPTDKDDDHYRQQFWELVRDETSIDIDRLTPNNVEKIYMAFQDMRSLFKAKHRAKYPPVDELGVTNVHIFFIDLLDEVKVRFGRGISRFQLHYGLRRDDNFGERMASRVLQWRLRLQNPDELLSGFPQMAHDVLPIEQQDENFKQMAETYALRFNKASSKTIVGVADDDDAMRNVDASNYSPKTAMLKKLDHKLTTLKADLKNEMGKVTSMENKLNGMADDNRKNFAIQKREIDGLRVVVNSVQKKQVDAEQSTLKLTDILKETKAKVSTLLRNQGPARNSR